MNIPYKLKVLGATALAIAIPIGIIKGFDLGGHGKTVENIRTERVVKIDYFKNKIIEGEAKIQDKEYQIQENEGKLIDERNSIKGYDEEIVRLSPLYEEAILNRKNADAQLDSIRGEAETLEAVIAEKKDHNNEKREGVGRLEENVAFLQGQKNELIVALNGIRSDIASKEKELPKIDYYVDSKTGERIGDFSGYGTVMFGGANEAMGGVRVTGYPEFLRFGDFSVGPFVSFAQGKSMVTEGGGDRSAIFIGGNVKWQPIKYFFVDGSVTNAYNNKGRENEAVKGTMAIGIGGGLNLGGCRYLRGGVDYLNDEEVFFSVGYGGDFSWPKGKK